MYTCIDDISSFCQTGNPEPKTQILTCTCSPGLGDRLRGIMMFLRAAAASKRVLLIDIVSPTDMREFFLPALIDWTVGLLALPKPDFPWKAGEGTTGRPCSRATRRCCCLRSISWYKVTQQLGEEERDTKRCPAHTNTFGLAGCSSAACADSPKAPRVWGNDLQCVVIELGFAIMHRGV